MAIRVATLDLLDKDAFTYTMTMTLQHEISGHHLSARLDFSWRGFGFTWRQYSFYTRTTVILHHCICNWPSFLLFHIIHTAPRTTLQKCIIATRGKDIRKHVSIIMFGRSHLMIHLMSSAIDCPEQWDTSFIFITFRLHYALFKEMVQSARIRGTNSSYGS